MEKSNNMNYGKQTLEQILFQNQNHEENKKQTMNSQISISTNIQRIVVLSKQGAQFYRLVDGISNQKPYLQIENDFAQYPTATMVKYAPNTGAHCAIVDELGIHFVDMNNGRERLQIVKSGINEVSAMEHSPRDTYLITCEKFQAGEKNLIIWHTLSGKDVASFEYKKGSKEGPKSIKFTKDEVYCARLVNRTTIEIYFASVFSIPKHKLIASSELLASQKKQNNQQQQIQEEYKFDGFEFVPQNPDIPSQFSPLYFACWKNSESLSDNLEDGVGTVYVFDLNQTMDRPKFKVECSRAQEIKVVPSPIGYAILVWSQNYQDSTGKSYYGEHSLQYVQLTGGKNRQFVPVFDGQIHDVQWIQSNSQFIVISGMQPATATLYNKDCSPLFEFGKRYRNTIRICPFSSLCMIGGFGNLTGEVDFWNVDSLEQIGNTKAYCSVSIEWAPNGKYLMTSVLYERVKVDNEIRIFSPFGDKLCSLSYDELYDAQWQPFVKGTFKKSSLQQIKSEITEIKEESKNQFQNGQNVVQKKEKKLYVPPGGSNSAFQQIMRQEMSKTNQKGPRKLEQDSYKDIMKEQAEQHANQVAAKKDQIKVQTVQQSSWLRKGQEQQYQEEIVIQQNPLIQNDQINDANKKSKHAKRRAKKKQKVVEGGEQQEYDENY